MNAIDIDTPALRRLLTETAAEIAAVKAELRQTWTREMADDQRTLIALKLRATHLCILRALLRGKYHLQRPMRRGWTPGSTWNREQFHREVAEQTADRYRLRGSGVLAAGARS